MNDKESISRHSESRSMKRIVKAKQRLGDGSSVYEVSCVMFLSRFDAAVSVGEVEEMVEGNVTSCKEERKKGEEVGMIL